MNAIRVFVLLALSLLLNACAGFTPSLGGLLGAGGGGVAGNMIARGAGGNSTVQAAATGLGAVGGYLLGDHIQKNIEASSTNDSEWQKLQMRSKPAGTAQRLDNGDGSYKRIQPMQYTDESGGVMFYDATYEYSAPSGNLPPAMTKVSASNWRQSNEAPQVKVDESAPVAPANPQSLPPKK